MNANVERQASGESARAPQDEDRSATRQLLTRRLPSIRYDLATGDDEIHGGRGTDDLRDTVGGGADVLYGGPDRIDVSDLDPATSPI